MRGWFFPDEPGAAEPWSALATSSAVLEQPPLPVDTRP